MGQVTVTWLEKRQFVGTDSSRHSVVMSTQDAENATGCMPSELLLVALGGCAGVDLIGILQKQRQKVLGLRMNISGEQDAEPPWAFRRVHVEVVVEGEGLSGPAVERAISLAVDKYCSVASTIRSTAQITTSYRLVERD